MGNNGQAIIGLESRAESAARMLNRKRIGLECAIEALETVGYRVIQGDSGEFVVSPPLAGLGHAGEDDSGAGVMQDGILDGYPALLKVNEVSSILDVSPRTVTRLCASSGIPSVKIGSSIRIPKQSLAELLACKDSRTG